MPLRRAWRRGQRTKSKDHPVPYDWRPNGGTVKAARSGMVLMAALVIVGLMSAGTVPTAASAFGGCPAHGQVVCVDRSDGGHVVHLRVGHTLRVVLGGSSLRWTGLRQSAPEVLRPSGPMVQRHGGISASYIAVKGGQTTLRAGGAPRCERGRACPQFVLLWQVHVSVS
jgi:hypothetical protein